MSYAYFAPPDYLKKRRAARATVPQSAILNPQSSILNSDPRAVESPGQSENLDRRDSRAGAPSAAPQTGTPCGDTTGTDAPASPPPPGAAPSPAAPALPATRICSWCGKVEFQGSMPATHGICDPCAEKHFGAATLSSLKKHPAQ